MTASCKSCRFYIGQDNGVCVKNAPMISGEGDNVRARWPGVSQHSWCGQHQGNYTALPNQRVTDNPRSAEHIHD